jgi:hypothetical protein
MKLFTYLSGLMLAILIFTIPVNAQAPNFSVANKAGSTALDRPQAIAVDNDGNVYVIAQFTGTVDFGGGVTLVSAGNVDYALVKYDSMGNTIWGKRGGGTLTDRGYGVGVDSYGNVYAAGEFFGTAIFGNDTLISNGAQLDIFVFKYDSSGATQWVRLAQSPSQTATRGLVVDNNNNVIITGYFGSTAAPQVVLDTITLTSYGQRDILVAKYNSNGDIQWAKNFGGLNSAEEGRAVTVDAEGNIYVTGIITGTAYFDGVVLNGNLGTDVFITKLSPSGNVLWAKSGGSNRADDGSGIAVDDMGNVYVVGKYDSAAVFGPFSLDRNQGLDAFVTKLSPSGEYLWLKYAGGPTSDYATDITCDRFNNLYVIGYFTGTAIIGDDTLTSAGSDDIYIWALTPDGNSNYVKHVTGSGVDKGIAITADYGCNLYVTGAFVGTLTLDSFQFTGAGNDDIFYARLGNNPVPVELLSFSASINGRDIVLNWSTATETNNSGFEVQRSSDNVTFEVIDFVAGKGTSTEKNSYSFSDRDLNPANYYYRLKQLDYDGTSSYSPVVEVNISVPSVFSLSQNYPNPFNPSTEIAFSLPVDAAVTIAVFNAIGEKVDEISKDYTAGNYRYTFNGSKISSGIYFYSINASGKDGSLFSSSKKMVLIK